MATTTAKTTARDKLLEAACELMLERGYAATTVDDICSHAGVSKGSFYHFFDSKEELGLAALEQYYEEGSSRLMTGPFVQEQDPQRKLLGFLRHTEENAGQFWGRGCLLGTFAVDLAATHPEIRERVAEMFDGVAQRMSAMFEPVAAARGRRTSAQELAESYLAALEGGIVLARAFNDPRRIRQSLEAFRCQVLPELSDELVTS